MLKSLNWALLVLTGLLLAGCGSKSADLVGTKNDKVFQSLDQETKTTWNIALAGLKTNGFAVSFMALKKLREHPNLNAEQIKALDETAKALSDQIYDAANKGDQNALDALKDLRQLHQR